MDDVGLQRLQDRGELPRRIARRHRVQARRSASSGTTRAPVASMTAAVVAHPRHHGDRSAPFATAARAIGRKCEAKNQSSVTTKTSRVGPGRDGLIHDGLIHGTACSTEAGGTACRTPPLTPARDEDHDGNREAGHAWAARRERLGRASPIRARPPRKRASSTSTIRAPGFTRRKSGTGFGYRDTKGAPIRDPAVLKRIRSLAIPPGLHRRVDLPPRQRPHPGDGPRRQGAQAVPLSSRLPAGAGRDQVRPHHGLRRRPAGASAPASTPTCPCAACPATRCWPPWSTFWRRR